MNIYVMRDSKAQTCGKNLMLFKTHGEAIRSVQQAMEGQGDNLLAKYPEDFALFNLGTYDEETGTIELLEQKTHVIDVLELVKE